MKLPKIFIALPMLCSFFLFNPSRGAYASALLKPSSGATQALTAKSLSVDTQIEGAFAQTTLTTVYTNPNTRRIEADFLYAAPQGSVVTGFAYWFGAQKVVAQVVKKDSAANIYYYTSLNQRDPALIEMTGKNAFRARIFPVEANQDLKIEIQLAQTLEATSGGLRWNYPLRGESAAPLQKLSLRVRSARKIVSNLGAWSNGELNVERENFSSPDDWRVDVAQNAAPLRASVLARRESAAGDGFFVLSLIPNAPVALPRLVISGVSTYDVLVPDKKRIAAGENYLIFGRYRASGKALVSLNGQSVQLDFGAAIQPNSVAAKLWAQRRIETLSNSDANQFTVIQLSKQFGLVSKWTSWLALPIAERARFERQIKESELDDTGRLYAQSVARGDLKTAAAQKKLFTRLERELNLEARDSGLQRWYSPTLSGFLNGELLALNDALARTKNRAQLAQWRRWSLNLQRAGAKAPSNDLKNKSKTQQSNALAALYVSEVEKSGAKSARARSLQAQLVRLTRPYRSTFASFVERAAIERAEKIALGIVEQRSAGQLSAAQAKAFNGRLRRVTALVSYEGTPQRFLKTAQTTFLNQRTKALRDKAAEAIRDGASVAQARRELDASWLDLQKSIGVRDAPRSTLELPLLEAATRRIMDEIKAGRGQTPENIQLAADIRTLDARNSSEYGKLSWRIAGGWALRGWELSEQLADEQSRNGRDSPRALQLAKELEDAVEKGKGVYYQSDTLADFVRTGIIRLQRQTNETLASLVAAGREDSPQFAALQSQLQRLNALDPSYVESQDYSYSYRDIDELVPKAWQGRAHETAYKLLEAQQKAPAQVAVLQSELERLSQKAGKAPQAYLEVERQRRKDGLPLLTAEQYRLRPGDPLVSVVAPPNCQRVVAIMPDGTLLPLRFDAQKGAWEARFDVPTHASDGDYHVQILIVAADGTRHQLTMNFAVDSSAPRGVGEVQGDGAVWKLTLSSDEHTDRVSAFTPWKSRVELKRNGEGVFEAQVEVPQQWRDQKAAVRFVLTDKAHNRTEILVDWN